MLGDPLNGGYEERNEAPGPVRAHSRTWGHRGPTLPPGKRPRGGSASEWPSGRGPPERVDANRTATEPRGTGPRAGGHDTTKKTPLARGREGSGGDA